MKVEWVDGRFDEDTSHRDGGFLTGNGVYETIGVFRGDIPLWDQHMARLAQGASKLGIPCRMPVDLPSQALGLLAWNPNDDILRVTITADAEGRPTWRMRTDARQPRRIQVLHIRLGVNRLEDPLPLAKSTSQSPHPLAGREAQEPWADDTLIVDTEDRVLETAAGNVFFWLKSGLCTPRLDGGILPGIARACLLAELDYLGVSVTQGQHKFKELTEHDGLFTTNAVYGPRPAVLRAGEKAALPPVVVEAWQRVVGRKRPRIKPRRRDREEGR